MPYHPTICCSWNPSTTGPKRAENTNKKRAVARCEALDVRYMPNGCPNSLPNGSGAPNGSQCSITL